MRRIRTANKLRAFTRNERGGALAELAILIPFLILMVAAVSELGRLFQTYDTLSKSTRTAARYLTTVTYTTENIQNTKNMAVCGKINCTDVEPLVPGLTTDNIDVTPEGDAGNPVRVTVSVKDYSFTPIFNLAAMLKADSFAALPVRASTTMYYWQVDPAGGKE
jgi:Flp pilus assembly protein TadG